MDNSNEATDPNAPRKCKAITSRGTPCKNWAMAGHDICNIHAGRTGGGAPLKNQNARKHGFYSKHFTDQEASDLIEYKLDDTVANEVEVMRVLNRRLLQYLEQHDLSEMDPRDIVRLFNLIQQGSRTVAALVRSTTPTSFNDFMDEVLTGVAKRKGLDL